VSKFGCFVIVRTTAGSPLTEASPRLGWAPSTTRATCESKTFRCGAALHHDAFEVGDHLLGPRADPSEPADDADRLLHVAAEGEAAGRADVVVLERLIDLGER